MEHVQTCACIALELQLNLHQLSKLRSAPHENKKAL